MNRRQFVGSATDGAGLLILPSTLLAFAPPEAKITQFRVGLESDMALLRSRVEVQDGQKVVSRTYGPSASPPPDRENHYEAAVIEIGDRFWYRAKGTTIEVTANEARQVRGCPLLFYFSTALKLHVRINWKLAHGVDYARP